MIRFAFSKKGYTCQYARMRMWKLNWWWSNFARSLFSLAIFKTTENKNDVIWPQKKPKIIFNRAIKKILHPTKKKLFQKIDSCRNLSLFCVVFFLFASTQNKYLFECKAKERKKRLWNEKKRMKEKKTRIRRILDEVWGRYVLLLLICLFVWLCVLLMCVIDRGTVLHIHTHTRFQFQIISKPVHKIHSIQLRKINLDE